MLLGLFFAVFLVIVFAYGVYEARDYPLLAQIFPLWISIVALGLSIVQLVQESRKYFLHVEEIYADFVDLAPDRSIPPNLVYRRGLRYLVWIVALYGGIWILGFLMAMTIFLGAFLRLEAGLRWRATVLLTISGSLFVIAVSWMLVLFWPEGLIHQWVDLPWPLS